MGSVEGLHHHRNTTKTVHKPFKSRHQSKGALRDKAKGRMSISAAGSKRQSQHQQIMSKIDRRHQAKQKLLLKKRQHARFNSIFSGSNGAARNVAIIPLCEGGIAARAIKSLNSSVGIDVEVADKGVVEVTVERFRQKLRYILANRSVLSAMTVCRAADFTILVLSAEQEVDELGESILRAIESQGISNVLSVIQDLDKVPSPKIRAQVSSSLKSFISHFFPAQEKVPSLDLSQECSNVIRSVCSTTPKGIRWREDRSWMLVEDVRWPDNHSAGDGEVIVTGVVRGKGLKADRLIQILGWGEFQISKITSAPATRKQTERNAESTGMELDGAVLEQPTASQDDLAELAPEESVMADATDYSVSEAATYRKGVLLDDHHYFEDDEDDLQVLTNERRRLPRGTSKYQSAWYLDDVSDSGSDISADEDEAKDIDQAEHALPQDGMEGLDTTYGEHATEMAPSEAPPQSEMFLDPAPADEADQLDAFRARHDDEEDQLQFPDEIELHPNVLARERLARYRGLKSLRTSTWNTSEDKAHEPDTWTRLLQVPNYKASRGQVTREALVGGVAPGTRVCVHISNVPLTLRDSYSASEPPLLVSLLRHEHKLTALNFSFTLSSSYSRPLKSKESLVIQVAGRKFLINPLYSQAGHTSNNIHKFARFVYPGQTVVASFIGPMTWGSIPAVFFRSDLTSSSTSLELIGTGTSLPPDPSRVIAKRVILTGHPYKIHKKLVTVRYMFFNTADVNWFKALQLFTKRGRSGYIKESLGTHGYFKATFDAKIDPQDSIGISLYKRMWPREAKLWNEVDAARQTGDEEKMDVAV